eukprot:1462405-Prymnesium_polylepis.1
MASYRTRTARRASPWRLPAHCAPEILRTSTRVLYARPTPKSRGRGLLPPPSRACLAPFAPSTLAHRLRRRLLLGSGNAAYARVEAIAEYRVAANIQRSDREVARHMHCARRPLVGSGRQPGPDDSQPSVVVLRQLLVQHRVTQRAPPHSLNEAREVIIPSVAIHAAEGSLGQVAALRGCEERRGWCMPLQSTHRSVATRELIRRPSPTPQVPRLDRLVTSSRKEKGQTTRFHQQRGVQHAVVRRGDSVRRPAVTDVPHVYHAITHAEAGQAVGGRVRLAREARWGAVTEEARRELAGAHIVEEHRAAPLRVLREAAMFPALATAKADGHHARLPGRRGERLRTRRFKGQRLRRIRRLAIGHSIERVVTRAHLSVTRVIVVIRILLPLRCLAESAVESCQPVEPP